MANAPGSCTVAGGTEHISRSRVRTGHLLLSLAKMNGIDTISARTSVERPFLQQNGDGIPAVHHLPHIILFVEEQFLESYARCMMARLAVVCTAAVGLFSSLMSNPYLHIPAVSQVSYTLDASKMGKQFVDPHVSSSEELCSRQQPKTALR